MNLAAATSNDNAAVDASLPFAIGRGETWENSMVRIHRYAESFLVIELAGAGKRGKRCRVLSLSRASYDRSTVSRWMDRMAVTLPDLGDLDSIRRLISDLLVDFPGEINMTESVARGVDIEPPCRKLHITTENLEVEATVGDVLVACRKDLTNEPRAIVRKKTDARRFYAWASDNEAAIRGMTFNALVCAAHDAGISLHVWCAMD